MGGGGPGVGDSCGVWNVQVREGVMEDIGFWPNKALKTYARDEDQHSRQFLLTVHVQANIYSPVKLVSRHLAK